MSLYHLAGQRDLEQIPFAHAFQAFVAAAQADLDLDAFSPGARASLESHLLHRLSFACGPALQHEFQRFHPPGVTLLSLFTGGETSQPPSHRYRAFIASLRDGGWDEFSARYPIARQFIASLAHDWREFCRTLSAHVRQDMAAHGAVERLEIGLSDPHNGGRSVVLLFFADDTAIVYKPRSVSLEASFSDQLQWCNQNLNLPDIEWYAPRVTTRDGYGWMEHIAHLPCRDESDLRHYYGSAGGLLALLYLLGATDCHCENVIAHGRYPVLVDAETLLQPRYTPPTGDDLLASAFDPLGWDTVARTGFLPRWEFTDDGQHVADVSGLAGNSEFASAPGPVWTNVNSDRMELGEGPLPARASLNRPFLDSGSADATRFLEQVEEGFEQTWMALERRRDQLPLAAFDSLSTRFIFRPTQLYVNLLWNSVQPCNLVSPERQCAVFEPLHRSLQGLPDAAAERQIVEREILALEHRDVPYFAVPCDATSLDAIPLRLQGSAWSNLRDRVRLWNTRSLARQRAIVRASLRALAARQVPFVEPAISFPSSTPAENQSLTSVLLGAAERIAEDLCASSFETDSGRQWLGLQARDPVDRFQFELLGLDLYSGVCGVALFFAASARIHGRPEHARIAREALAPLCALLQSGSSAQLAELAARMGPGAACGIGAIVYSLARVAELLADPSLLEHAHRAARLIREETLAADHFLDIVAGAAGGILGLVALHNVAPDPELLVTARLCGDHLLSTRTGDAGMRAWRNFARLPLTGFAHGAAGIGLALLRLYRAAGDESFRAAAEEARAYERSLFNPERNNWPDLRDNVMVNGQPGFSSTWCHGAPGIGLSRLDYLADDRAASMAEIDAALSATLDYGIMGPDYLCCGNMGRIEWLLAAGIRLNRSDLVEKARAAAAFLARRAHLAGGFRLLANANADGCKPGFFRGTAGIGYSLLRCAAPGELPCVLAFE